MELTPATKVISLIKRYDFLLEYLSDYAPEFKKLKNPIMRNTVGRFATLQMAASMASVPLDRLVVDLQQVIKERAGEVVTYRQDTTPSMEPERLEALKAIILDLHKGASVAQVKQRFAELIQEVSPAEIAQMEQQLIAEGLPQEEVKRLCDVHVQVFKESLDQQEQVSTPPGHPVHTFQAENVAIRGAVEKLQALLEKDDKLDGREQAFTEALHDLAEIDKHYLRKENQLFPFLEKRGVVGPTQVMWAIHDDARELLKETRRALMRADLARVKTSGAELATTVLEMIYKEDNILFPMSMQVLEENDWAEIRRGEDEIGYALVMPGDVWTPADADAESDERPQRGRALDALGLDTGLLSLEQVNLMLKHLPVDISFVDENDEVLYYSDTSERIFPRSPGVIGRKVQYCHPQKSVHMVNQILEAFRDDSRDTAEFWIEMGGRFIHIRYFAIRDGLGTYRGTLEVSQDVTGIRKLEGQRRLLDWDKE